VRRIAEQVHREGGLLELDKHNWPWSMMLVPVMKVDLYELTNNHVWRTEFAFTQFGELPAPYMNAEQNEQGLTEQGWLDFTFQNYYALLNCGFRMRPTAGTASGVHPVPLGFGRVYVHLPDGFSYDGWMKGLHAGRSFVTTGPMLVVTANGQRAGTPFQIKSGESARIRLQGWASSEHPLSRIELISSKGVLQSIKPQQQRADGGAFSTDIDVALAFSESTWVAVRCYEQLPNGRTRFAHTSPTHIDIPGKPLRPRKHEVQYLVDRVQSEIDRNTGVLTETALDEFREALDAYKAIAATAE
ncbi:MAG: CehA/McbA family metallohydrolase, partial [Planctomycetia bacterium]|nr:CehA/McbA family metallohydrolase [Planctomycetia bacterium]